MKLLKYSVLLVIIILTSIHFHSFAQTGPGGVGNATNNVLWLSSDYEVFNDAGTTEAENNDNVQRWNDRSGNNNHANQGTVGRRPNYITNVANGNPALRYSAGNSDVLEVLGVTTANVASIWTVASYSSLPSSNPGIFQGSPSGLVSSTGVNDKKIGVWVNNTNSRVWGRGIQSNNAARNISQTTALTVNTIHSISSVYRTNRIDQYVDNNAAGNNTAHNGTLGSWADISIGRQGNESWNGDIVEVIVFNTEVNNAQRIIIDNYLSAKYGFGLASNDIYIQDDPANGNYDFEVAGIGRIDASNINDNAQGTGLIRILNPTDLNNDEFLFWGHDNGIAQATEKTDVPAGVIARFDRVWRVNEVNVSGTAVDVGAIDMRFDLNNLGPITASDVRLLIDFNNDGVFANDVTIGGAVDLGGGIYEFPGVTGISNNLRFTIGTIDPNQTPLPIELVSFNAKLVNDEYVNLEWITASEINNDFFTIEKSKDGLNWEVIQTIKGAGNSSAQNNYATKDSNPIFGQSFYRLKQTDFDGAFTYSNVETINLEYNRLDFTISPNPTKDILRVTFNDESKFEDFSISNLEGKILRGNYKLTGQENNTLTIDVSNLPSGIYFLTIGSSSKKFVKQ